MASCRNTRLAWRSAFAAGTVALLCTGAPSVAQPVDASTQRAVVEKLATELRSRYVFPDVAEKAAELVIANSRKGAYDGSLSPSAFVARLTSDLRSVAHDKHLSVEAAGAPPSISLPEPPKSEAGVVRADRLSGGVGYIEVASFPPPQNFKPVIDKAMRALGGSRALIIDVRRNTGGSPASVAYLVSFLLPPGQRMPINDVVSRTPSTTTLERQSFTREPTPVSFEARPLYVLTSANTFSGGEEFAYDVQSLRAGTIIGETTGGGANPTGSVNLGSGYSALIPFGRSENPITKTNWEGSGVVPDRTSTASDALQVALRHLKEPAAREISQASRRQVFAPRSKPIAGSEAALRRVLEQVAAGQPDYPSMSPNAQATTKARLDRLRETLVGLGAIRSLSFMEADAFGGDDFAATFAFGTARLAIALTPDGKVDGWGIFEVVRAAKAD
ncbi:MAG: S41 family peptidase [Caulobacteraceae bacterium]